MTFTPTLSLPPLRGLIFTHKFSYRDTKIIPIKYGSEGLEIIKTKYIVTS